MKRVVKAFCRLLVSTGACVLAFSAFAQDDSDVGSTMEPLWQTGGKWPDGRISVCWHPDSVDRSDFREVSVRVRNAALRSWPAIAKVDFLDWDTCRSDRPAGRLRIALFDPGPGTGTAASVGYSPGGLNWMNIVISSVPNATEALKVVSHEFAHVLGFGHEFDRNGGTKACPGQSIPGDDVNTAYDPESITVATYCHNSSELTIWDAVGAQAVYGHRTNDVRPLISAWNGQLEDHMEVTSDAGITFANRSGYGWAYALGWVPRLSYVGTRSLDLYWHAKRRDYFLLSNPESKEAARLAGYRHIRREGYVFTRKYDEAMVAVDSWWSPDRDEHMLVRRGSNSEVAARGAGYVRVRNEGFVFKDRPYDMLWRLWSPARSDNLVAAERSPIIDAAQTAQYIFAGFDGAIWRNQLPVTAPLTNYWRGTWSDHFTLADPRSRRTALGAGYGQATPAPEGFVHRRAAPGAHGAALKSYWNSKHKDYMTTIFQDQLALDHSYSLVRIEGWGLNTE